MREIIARCKLHRFLIVSYGGTVTFANKATDFDPGNGCFSSHMSPELQSTVFSALISSRDPREEQSGKDIWSRIPPKPRKVFAVLERDPTESKVVLRSVQ